MLEVQAGPRRFRGVELVIFDKDGTLFDVHHYWGQMIQMRARAFSGHVGGGESLRAALVSAMGFDEAVARLRPEGPVGVLKRAAIVAIVRDVLATHGHRWSEAEVETVFLEIDQISEQRLGEMIKVLPGVREFLAACQSSGTRAAIATTDKSNRARLALQVAEMEKDFVFIAGADNVSRPKPDREIADFVLSHLGVAADRAIMVGDHEVDIMVARNAGLMGAIGVATGLHGLAELNRLNDANVENLTQLEWA